MNLMPGFYYGIFESPLTLTHVHFRLKSIIHDGFNALLGSSSILCILSLFGPLPSGLLHSSLSTDCGNLLILGNAEKCILPRFLDPYWNLA